MTNDTTDRVVLERSLPNDPAIVWRALTESALIAEWLLPNDFAPVVGRAFRFQAEPSPHWDGRVDGQILEVEPERRLSYTWVAQGGVDTVVYFTLEAEGEGARVRVEQSGFGPDQARSLQGARYGCEQFLGGLERVVANVPAPMPQPIAS
jgi:uncharacterized protein YndB with AHSA1/START domain